MPKNVVAYNYKNADSGINTMYHEFGSSLVKLHGISVGRNPLSHESQVVGCRVSLLNSRNNPTSILYIGEECGINSVWIPGLNLEVQSPECLRVELNGVDTNDSIWFKVVTAL